MQKLLRALDSNNIDHRLQQADLTDETIPHLGMPIVDVDHLNEVLLVGSDIYHEQPVLGIRLRKAIKNGAKITVINNQFIEALTQFQFSNGEKKAIILGPGALNNSKASQIKYLATQLAEKAGAVLGCLTVGANSVGAHIVGAIPKNGLNSKQMMEQPLVAYLLMNVEPEFDCAYSRLTLDALHKAKLVVCFTTFVNQLQLEYAHVLLPVAPFTENEGSYINIEGRSQTFTAATIPYQEARPAWKVLRVLGNLLQQSGFEYSSCLEVQKEFINFKSLTPLKWGNSTNSATQPDIQQWSIYGGDSLVRRAKSLQAIKANVE